jgi:hypothetical protein
MLIAHFPERTCRSTHLAAIAPVTCLDVVYDELSDGQKQNSRIWIDPHPPATHLQP